jgi:phospholipid transport system substrate-binding protein
MMRKRWVSLVFFSALWLVTAVVQAAEPVDMIKSTAKQTFEAIEGNRDSIKTDPGKIYGLVETIVLPSFDFDLMARWVLGKHWKKASAEQQQKFIKEFRSMLVRTYASQLLEHRYEDISIGAVTQIKDDRVKVATEVKRKAGKPYSILYNFRKSEDGWKVYDVVIEGISLVTNYRSAFESEINRGDIDGLIAKLAERNSKQQVDKLQ